jgi:hypothetical protein
VIAPQLARAPRRPGAVKMKQMKMTLSRRADPRAVASDR